MILPESIRWLKLNGRLEEARKEIKRAAKFNCLNYNNDDNKMFDANIDEYLKSDTKADVSIGHDGMTLPSL